MFPHPILIIVHSLGALVSLATLYTLPGAGGGAAGPANAYKVKISKVI